jgi:hypothetical protein
MTLSVTTIGDNAEEPGIAAYAYNPDQLIAGDLKVVTNSVNITGGADLQRGTVLGQVRFAAPANAAPAGAGGGGANTGNGVISAIALGAAAKIGTYAIKFTGATAATITDPDGDVLPALAAAGAYASSQIGFTFTAGGTAMVAGDGFTLAVAAGSGSYKESVATATDGSQFPSAILLDTALCATNAGDQTSVVALQGEFNAYRLTLDASWSAATVEQSFRNNGRPIYLKNIGVLDLTNAAPS